MNCVTVISPRKIMIDVNKCNAKINKKRIIVNFRSGSE